jgi:RNA polymerase sigma factor (sigma-70 family)
MILRSGGNPDDARDIFQDALIVFLEKADSPEFNLSSSAETYLYSICKNIWLRQKKKKSRTGESTDGMESTDPLSEYFLEEINALQLRKIMDSYFNRLPLQCRQIIGYSLEQYSYDEIRLKLDLASVEYVRNRYYLCKKKLVEMISSDPSIKDMI